MKQQTVIIFSLFSLLSSIQVFSQENQETKDSTKTKINNLEQVVVTGQYSPQSVKKSVFEVTVISKAQIDQQAANNLADVLNQTLNINIIPNASTGKSGVQMFGLDAQYFKILVDNIPIINDEGLGNNTDLTQMNLDDIQQIEIVEGSMGVQYGANAVSGVINIITKKSGEHKWEITPYLQEETIGDEYNLQDEGRHIQSIKVGHNFSDKFYGNVSFSRNDFRGFWDDRKGQNYFEDDGLRGYSWLPKRQNTIKTIFNYTGKNNFRTYYKFEYFDENIERYDATIIPNYNASTQTTNPTASDEIFTSKRFYHHLNFFGKVKNSFNYDVSFSYQQQKRNVEVYNFRIKSGEKFDVENFEYESRKVLYSKGTFSDFLEAKHFDFQLGYEVNNIDGYASSVAGTFGGENIKRELGSYDFFTSAEIYFNDNFSLRPGVRMLTSTKFKTQAAVSLSAKYAFNNGLEVRGIVGSSPRMPNYDELFTYFVDANHDVRGNEDLKPEQGFSTFLHLKKRFNITDNFLLSSKLSSWYLNVNDRIELIVVNNLPLQFQFRNIDEYKTWGMSFTNSTNYKNLNASLGFTFAGTSKVLDSRADFNDDYLYSMQVNANTSYYFTKLDLVLSAYYKHTGALYQYVEQIDENNETIITRGKQGSYNSLDTSLRKNFFKRNLQVTIGARNLFDVKSVNTTAVEGGAHNGPPSSILLRYGRSYYLKLLYKLNF